MGSCIVSTVFSSCTVYTERTIDNHKERWRPAPLTSRDYSVLCGLLRLPTAPTASAAAAETGSRRGSRGWRSSSDEDDCCHASASSSERVPTPSRAARHRRLQTAELRRHRHSGSHFGSSRLQHRTLAAPSPASAPSNALCGCAGATPSRAFARTTKAGSTVGTAGRAVRMASVPPRSLTCTLPSSGLRSSSRSRRTAPTGKP